MQQSLHHRLVPRPAPLVLISVCAGGDDDWLARAARRCAHWTFAEWRSQERMPPRLEERAAAVDQRKRTVPFARFNDGSPRATGAHVLTDLAALAVVGAQRSNRLSSNGPGRSIKARPTWWRGCRRRTHVSPPLNAVVECTRYRGTRGSPAGRTRNKLVEFQPAGLACNDSIESRWGGLGVGYHAQLFAG